MKKIFSVILTALILGGCSYNGDIPEASNGAIVPVVNTAETVIETSADTSLPAEVSVQSGREDETCQPAPYTLMYKNRIYSLTHTETSETVNFKHWLIVGKELRKAFRSGGVYWSDTRSGLEQVDLRGTVYSVRDHAKGDYDEDFRVCICYETTDAQDNTVYGIEIYDSLDNVALSVGSDLYKDRLHLNDHAWAYSTAALPMPDETLSEFLDALYESEFIDPDLAEAPDLETAGYTPVYFEDLIGAVTEIRVYPDGYAAMVSGDNMYISRLDSGICQKMTELVKYTDSLDLSVTDSIKEAVLADWNDSTKMVTMYTADLNGDGVDELFLNCLLGAGQYGMTYIYDVSHGAEKLCQLYSRCADGDLYKDSEGVTHYIFRTSYYGSVWESDVKYYDVSYTDSGVSVKIPFFADCYGWYDGGAHIFDYKVYTDCPFIADPPELAEGEFEEYSQRDIDMESGSLAGEFDLADVKELAEDDSDGIKEIIQQSVYDGMTCVSDTECIFTTNYGNMTFDEFWNYAAVRLAEIY